MSTGFDPTLPLDDPLAGEVETAGVSKETQEKLEEDERIRRIVANVYTFVRSQEINRHIASFTFDHYVDEAIRRLQGEGRKIRDASGQTLGEAPAKLEALEKLKTDFEAVFAKAQERARKADEEGQQES